METSRPSLVLDYRAGPLAFEDVENSIVWTFLGNRMKEWPTIMNCIPAVYIFEASIFEGISQMKDFLGLDYRLGDR